VGLGLRVQGGRGGGRAGEGVAASAGANGAASLSRWRQLRWQWRSVTCLRATPFFPPSLTNTHPVPRLSAHLYPDPRPEVSILLQYFKRSWQVPKVLDPLLKCRWAGAGTRFCRCTKGRCAAACKLAWPGLACMRPGRSPRPRAGGPTARSSPAACLSRDEVELEVLVNVDSLSELDMWAAAAPAPAPACDLARPQRIPRSCRPS
jgi:hypothetical protein